MPEFRWRAWCRSCEKQDVRPLGFARGEVWVADDFDAPLPDELLKQFYGGTLPELIDAPRRRKRK